MQTPLQLFTARRMATMVPGQGGYGLIDEAALVAGAGRILWVRPVSDMPPAPATLTAQDPGDALGPPARIDCHTHAIHGGNRAAEFARQLIGATCAPSARAASEQALITVALAPGLPDRRTLAPGQRADLAVWACADPAKLPCRIGFNPLIRRITGAASCPP